MDVKSGGGEVGGGGVCGALSPSQPATAGSTSTSGWTSADREGREGSLRTCRLPVVAVASVILGFEYAGRRTASAFD